MKGGRNRVQGGWGKKGRSKGQSRREIEEEGRKEMCRRETREERRKDAIVEGQKREEGNRRRGRKVGRCRAERVTGETGRTNGQSRERLGGGKHRVERAMGGKIRRDRRGKGMKEEGGVE